MIHKFERLIRRLLHWFRPKRPTKGRKMSLYKVVPWPTEDYRLTDWYVPFPN